MRGHFSFGTAVCFSRALDSSFLWSEGSFVVQNLYRFGGNVIINCSFLTLCLGFALICLIASAS